MGRRRRCEEMLKVRTKTNMSSKDAQRISFASMYSHKMVFCFEIVSLFSILLILMRSTLK